jgi:hypothetical protein
MVPQERFELPTPSLRMWWTPLSGHFRHYRIDLKLAKLQ